MKTPREILLQRHQSARPQLDSVRERALAGLSHREAGAGHRSFLVILQEVLALPRPAWAGLAMAWIVILALNLAAGGGREERPATVAQRTPVSRQALAEQRRFYVELVRSPMSADVPTFVPRPRSEGRLTIAAA